jgi:16S rRNA (guanine966-N2)-methyltransferase
MPRGVRPTQDRVRKSLFDVLGKDVAGRRALDLFAGSGALGVEALSRGAVSALFVDEDAGAVRAILANLADLGLMEGQEVWRADYRQAVRRIKREGRAFDLVLLDPPYREGLLPEALRALTGAGGVAPSGLVVAEAEARLPAPEVEGLALIDERVYGGTKLMFWLSQR